MSSLRSIIIVVLIVSFCASFAFGLTGCSLFDSGYQYSCQTRDCDVFNYRMRAERTMVAKYSNDYQKKAASYGFDGGVYPFIAAPLEEIEINWALWKGTDIERAPRAFWSTCLEQKRSFPEQEVYYCTKKLRVKVPDFMKGRKLDSLNFEFYHDKVIVVYEMKKDMPEEERDLILGYYYLEDGTPYDYWSSTFPEFFKKDPTATEEDYLKEQRRLYDAFREKFPGKSDVDFIMFLRYTLRAPKVNAKAGYRNPMIEYDIKIRSYVIPDWMKPYENTPL